MVTPVGDRIAELLKEKEWSQADLARRVGVSRAAVSAWVGGQDPSVPYLRLIADAFGVSVGDLFGPHDPAVAVER